MGNFNQGKIETCDYLTQSFAQGSTLLDVGACDGVWSKSLRNHFQMDAVEIFLPNIETFRLASKYDHVYNCDIFDFKYKHYDVVLFGDVIEHMEVDRAQAVLKYALDHAGEVIVAVPYLYKQAAIYGNKWEKHIQDDLTHEVFMERYPGFERFLNYGRYGYYRRG